MANLVAITSYTTLLEAVAAELNRSDLTGDIPGGVFLAHKKILLKVKRKSTTATVSIAAATVALPAGVQSVRSLRLVSGSPHLDVPLNPVTPDMLAEHRARTGDAAGRPRWYTILSSGSGAATLSLVPRPDATYSGELTYYSTAARLVTSSQESNEILDEAPQLYLYGTLLEFAAFLEHDERLPLWKSLFDEAVLDMNKKRDLEESPGGFAPTRIPNPF